MEAPVRIIPDGQLVFGMQLPIQSQSSLYVADWERTSGPDEIVSIARTADETGFFYVAVCDHIAIPRRLTDGMGVTWYDTIATLGMLAGVTTRVRLMSHVWVAPYRHPLVSAKAFATLDHLSKGRVIVGVGAGHVADEFATLGVPFERRGRLLDEAIDAISAALTDEFAAFSGPTWSFHDSGVRPRPVQRPRPPIWVGGSSPAALRRAAERGDGWLPQGTPRKQMPDQVAVVRAHREQFGTDPIEIGAVCEFIHVGTPSWEVGRGVISGKAEAIASSVREFKDMGVSHLQVRFKARSCPELEDQMRAFACDVVPLVNH
jgi:probable F420-dependent oxidoreductase